MKLNNKLTASANTLLPSADDSRKTADNSGEAAGDSGEAAGDSRKAASEAPPSVDDRREATNCALPPAAGVRLPATGSPKAVHHLPAIFYTSEK